MSRSRIAGTLELSCDGQLQAVLRDWWLEDDGVTFTLELPLPLELLHNAPLPRPNPLPRPDEAADALLQVSWGSGESSEAGLRIPPMNSAVGRVTHRLGESFEPMLNMTRSIIRAGQWVQEMTFAPLPDGGGLAFRLSSSVLGIRGAVDVVSVEQLRSRII